MLKWIAIIQAILDILKTLPFAGGDVGIQSQEALEAQVNEVLTKPETTDALNEALDVTVKPEDWTEIVPALVTIFRFFLSRRGQ